MVSATLAIYFELTIGFSGPKTPIKDILHGNLYDIWEKLDFDLFLLDLTSRARPSAGLDGQRDLGHIFWAKNWIQRPRKPHKRHIAWVDGIQDKKCINKHRIYRRQYFFFHPTPWLRPWLRPRIRKCSQLFFLLNILQYVPKTLVFSIIEPHTA